MFLDDRSKVNFLTYANSVIKSRAIPRVEDNLKPIHRKILYTLWEDKIYDTSHTHKCAKEAGKVLTYSPHGDASVYNAMVRMAQWWKLRYPLITIQGNCGNIFGDGPAASRYTECKLSPVGMMMLEDLNKNCVEFKPNFDETTIEPVTLPSKFPYLLCGNNSGIAVGMSSDLVSHNFTEVSGAIKYYLKNKDCSIADLMQFIKGPDFPTAGKIINGEELLNIYSTGRGSLKVCSHYSVSKKGQKTVITFHDLPYGVDIDDGVKTPLKKLVIEEGYDIFEDIEVKKVGARNFDILVTLSKGANLEKALDILFKKTRLANTIKINQTVIIDGEPVLLNLKELIKYWVDYRSNIIKKIALNDYQKLNHKMTVILGLQKALSNIDLLIKIIREADSRMIAKDGIMKAFELNDEQAEAILETKLSRLSRLDITELDQDKEKCEKELAKAKKIVEEESERYQIISNDLDDIKKKLGSDERLTEIEYGQINSENAVEVENLIKKEYRVYKNGIHENIDGVENVNNDILKVLFAYSDKDIFVTKSNGEFGPIKVMEDFNNAFVKDNKEKFITVTKNGYVKVSKVSDYKWAKSDRALKLKDGDELIYADVCNNDDFLILFDGERILKLLVGELPVASKLTLGTKSGFVNIQNAFIAKDSDLMLMTNADNKSKLVSIKDFSVNSRGNKGQDIPEDIKSVIFFDENRTGIILVPKIGKATIVNRNKVSVKSKNSVGALLSSKIIAKIV